MGSPWGWNTLGTELCEPPVVVQEICESAEDSILDLIDYCHRKLTLLAARSTTAPAATSAELPAEPLASPLSMQVRSKPWISLGTCVLRNVGRGTGRPFHGLQPWHLLPTSGCVWCFSVPVAASTPSTLPCLLLVPA